MTEYVLGFAFDGDDVLLIEKNRPAWQAGRLNGIGGKVEPGELVVDAMRREFFEETGIVSHDWTLFAIADGQSGYRMHVLATDTANLRAARQTTDERLFLASPWHTLVHKLHGVQPIENLPWLMAMARMSLRMRSGAPYHIRGGPLP